MSVEPQKFFIGLVDFFSILMPGALLAYLGKDWAGSVLLKQSSFPLDSSERLVVFLFASYLLGHFVFLLGAFLDEWVYDPLRSATPWGQIGRLAKGEPLRYRWIRRLAQSDLLFGKNADAAVMKAQRLKAEALQPISAGTAVNAYQWCKARLSKEHPEGLAAVQRFEADSKFFRSFGVVLLVLAAIAPFFRHWGWGLVCLVLFLPALLRYIDQRFKGTQQAYWFVITLEAIKPKPPAPDFYKLTHAGGVVFRKFEETIKYLLVTASQDRTRWVLPKGHIEPGENDRETAVREVHEESGNWARVVQWIDDVRLGENSLTRLYLMEFIEDNGQKIQPEKRQLDWITPEEAAKRQDLFPKTKGVLAAAEKLRLEISQARL